jgi:Family of unknown function (DUF6804)
MSTMTAAEAERIVEIVSDALQLEGHRHRPVSALMGYDLGQICTALKLCIANEFLLIENGFRPDLDLAEGAALYDSIPWSVVSGFVPDDQVDSVVPERAFADVIDASTMKLRGPFATEETGTSLARFCESIGPGDPDYWRKVYARIGLEYTPASPTGNRPYLGSVATNEQMAADEGRGPFIWLPQAVASVLLLWALYPDNPYSYYTLLRWVVCGIFAFLAVKARDHDAGGWVWALGITAALYNPVVPVGLGREVWSLVNVATAGLALASLFVFRPRSLE